MLSKTSQGVGESGRTRPWPPPPPVSRETTDRSIKSSPIRSAEMSTRDDTGTRAYIEENNMHDYDLW